MHACMISKVNDLSAYIATCDVDGLIGSHKQNVNYKKKCCRKKPHLIDDLSASST